MNPLLDTVRNAFLDELQKIAFSAKAVQHTKARQGRRPISASTLLQKEKEGEILKLSGDGGVAGTGTEYSNTDYPGVTGKPALAPRVKGEVPSREDGRENQATVIPGAGKTLLAPASTNSAE